MDAVLFIDGKIASADFNSIQPFYIDYFREFLAPLVIIFATWLVQAVPALNRDEILERIVLRGLCVSAIAFFAESYK
jgi:hypothetical protein